MNYPSLSGAVTTFLLERSAAGRSPHTIADYRNYLKVFVDYLDDPDLNTISTQSVNEFLNYLQTDYRVKRGGVETDHLISPKTVANVQTTLITFWKWATAQFKIQNPCNFDRIKFTAEPVDPLTEEEVAAMFRAVMGSRLDDEEGGAASGASVGSAGRQPPNGEYAFPPTSA